VGVYFPPFRLDLDGELLWRGTERVAVRPKAFTVLRYLIDNAGRLVGKDELLDFAWPDTAVNEEAVAEVVRELRRALGDEQSPPRFIETVYGKGFRFVAPVGTDEHAPSGDPLSALAPLVREPSLSTVVGRVTELAQLEEHLRIAVAGRRQVVFIEGEPGIGKTALVATFLDSVPSAYPSVRVTMGQCIDQHGAVEPYLPLLEALGRLVEGPQGRQVVPQLRQRAPMWLMQLPWLLPPEETERLQVALAGVSPQRMPREFAVFVEALTAEVPWVLVLEDLHWSDLATTDLLALLAERREPARLLVLVTYRATDAVLRQHPVADLVPRLLARRRCTQLTPEFLSADAVGEYMARRFQQTAPAPELVRRLHQRTDGNPLFMVALVDHMVREGLLTEHGESADLQAALHAVPPNLRYLVDAQLAALSTEDRAVLDAASAAGVTFTAAAVAAVLELTQEAVESACAALARRELFLQSAGSSEWPDGTLTERYSFRHALYHEILYHGLPEGRRQRLHRGIGNRMEAAYGTRSGEIATELALHFDRGRDHARAVPHYQAAANNALRRFANREAVTHLATALERLAVLPADRERDQQELHVQATLATTLLATQGFALEQMRCAFARLGELSQQLDDPLHRFVAIGGQLVFHYNRAQHQTAQAMGEELLQLTEQLQAPWLSWGAHIVLGQVLFSRGAFATAREHLELGLPRSRRPQVALGIDGGVVDLSYLTATLLALGYPEQARQRRAQLIERGRQVDHGFSLAFSLYFAGIADALLGESPETLPLIDRCEENGFEFGLAAAKMLHGVRLALDGRHDEAIASLRRGLEEYRGHGQEQGSTFYFVRLADAYGKAGKRGAGLEILARTLTFIEESDERWYEAELFRVQGELLSANSGGRKPKGKHQKLGEAEACYLRAIQIAQNQHAKLWELRATMSLCRLWRRQGKREQARRKLAAVYGWFTEGFETRDLQEAKALRQELGEPR